MKQKEDQFNSAESPQRPSKVSSSRSRHRSGGNNLVDRQMYSSRSSDKQMKKDYYDDRNRDKRDGQNDQIRPYNNRDGYYRDSYNKDRQYGYNKYNYDNRDGQQMGQDRKYYNNHNNNYNQGMDNNYKKFTHLTLRRYRNPGESLIRVHFFIRDVYVENGDAERFIFQTKDRIQKCGEVDILQMLNHNKDTPYPQKKNNQSQDLAIGMRYDQDAKKIVDGVRVIKLLDRSGKLLNQNIEISPLFKEQILNEEKAYKKRKYSTSMSKSKQKAPKKKHSYKSQSSSKTPEQREPKKKVKSKVDFDRRLFLFGIPEQFEAQDVIQTLEKKGMQVLKHTWETYNVMSYLAITLENQVQHETLIDSDLFLEKEVLQANNQTIKIDVPVLVLPEDKTMEIEQQLRNYQVRLEYTQEISPVTLYNLFKKYGTIINLFRDQNYLQIIYSKPHDKLTLTIPQKLNIIQPEPFLEMNIEVLHVQSSEVIERQSLIKTIQYQIQVMQQQQKQRLPQNTDINNNALTSANNKIAPKVVSSERSVQSQSASRSRSESKSSRSPSRSRSRSRYQQRSKQNSQSPSNKYERQRSMSGQKSPYNKNVFKRGEGGEFVKENQDGIKGSQSRDRQDNYRRYDQRRYDDRDGNQGYNRNRQDSRDYYNNRRGGRGGGGVYRQNNMSGNNNNRGGGTDYGKNFNNYNDKDYNYSGRNNYNNNNKGYGQQDGYDRNNNNRNYNNNNRGGGINNYQQRKY